MKIALVYNLTFRNLDQCKDVLMYVKNHIPHTHMDLYPARPWLSTENVDIHIDLSKENRVAFEEYLTENDVGFAYFGTRRKYTKKELDEVVEYFHMIVPYPLEFEGTRVEKYGTKYTGGCPNCGMGRQLVGDIIVPRRFLKQYDIGILEPDYYVSDRVRTQIENMNLTGISFQGNIRDYSNKPLGTTYHVCKFDHIMPPVAVETNLVEYKLVRCSEHCRLYMYGEIFYHRRDIHDMKDFNTTCEYINNDETYQLIVSNRVRKMLIENKVRVYHFTPIVIIED